MNNLLYYNSPAKDWDSALPIGNGSLGAMCFGGVKVDRLQMNQESIWAGPPVPENIEGSYIYLDQATKYLQSGEYLKAQKILQNNFMGERISPRSYQTMGDLYINLDIDEEYINYRRELNIKNALVTTSWNILNKKFTKEYFSSYPENAIIHRTICNEPFSGTINYTRDGDVSVLYSQNGRIIINGQAEHNGEHRGIKFNSQVQIYIDRGELGCTENSLNFTNVTQLLLIIKCETNYYNDKIRPIVFSNISYSEILSRHVKEYQSYFNRMELEFYDQDENHIDKPTDIRLHYFKENPSPSLISLYFNYARYLLISSSRPDSLCANLQGIWNKDMEAPWNSDYHININIQMIYWFAEVSGLWDCHLPFLNYAESLLDNGKETSRIVYNSRGTVSHHTSDIWKFTAPCGEVEYGMWPLGSAWNSRHFMEHYIYTKDRVFLEKRAFPFIKENAIFLYDYLVEDISSKLLVFGPASSPENRFLDPKTGEICNISLGISMGQQIVKEVFTNYLSCLQILNISDEYHNLILDALYRLKPVEIGQDGRLLEWIEDFKESEPGHRHISHLYGLYPGVEYLNNEKYLLACEKTLYRRLKYGGGHTGWSRAWIVNLWARLQKPVECWKNLNALINESTLINLLDNHPPFQLDGNMGGASGILEMLLQYRDGEPVFLPSLPKELSHGYVKGLRLRNGSTLNMAWEDGLLTDIELLPSVI
ncbi:MAG: glycoside hydrolase family 95 protein [Spirochaetales bacterium]|nr:glycoside hydrolase family 95 protein [Spirochaetales bacterium]